MRCTALASFLCAALVAADSASVIKSLQTLTTSLNDLDKDVNATQPGLGLTYQALQVEVDSITVDDNILASIDQVNTSPKFCESESQSIIASLENVTVAARQALIDVTGKRSAIGGLFPVVVEALYQLKMDTLILGYALDLKLDPSVVPQLQSGLSALITTFNKAIVTYGGTSS